MRNEINRRSRYFNKKKLQSPPRLSKYGMLRSGHVLLSLLSLCVVDPYKFACSPPIFRVKQVLPEISTHNLYILSILAFFSQMLKYL